MGLVRLSIPVTPETKTQLEKLAGRFRISQRKLIEEMIDWLYSQIPPDGPEMTTPKKNQGRV